MPLPRHAIAFALFLAISHSQAWACTEPASEVMSTQVINAELELTKLGHYCKAGDRFASKDLAEAMSLDWAEYSFQLKQGQQVIDLASLAGSERRLKKFAKIENVPLTFATKDLIALQFIAKGSSNVYSEIHMAKLQDSSLVPMATVIEPLTQYQAQGRSGSEYIASGFYNNDQGQWFIDSLAPSKETAECNACQKYDVISWLWNGNQLVESSRQAYDIETYSPLAQ